MRVIFSGWNDWLSGLGIIFGRTGILFDGFGNFFVFMRVRRTEGWSYFVGLIATMVTEEKHGDEKGEEEDSNDSEFEEQALLVMFDEFVIESGDDRRDAVDFEEVVLIVENRIYKVLIVAEISEREVFIALFVIYFRKVSVGASKEEGSLDAFEDFFAAFEANDSAIVLVESKVSKGKVRFHACFDDVGIGE